MDHSNTLTTLKKLHSNYTSCGKPFDTDYAWGFCNGLEAAIALLEKRPPFYLDRHNSYDKLDQDRYPEHFL